VLKHRLLTAAIALPLLFLVLWIGGPLLTAVVFLFFLLMNFEFYTLATAFGFGRRLQLTLISALIPIGFLISGPAGFAGGVVLAAMLALAFQPLYTEREQHQPEFRENLSTAALGVIYPGIIGAVLVVVTRGPEANIAIAWLLSVVFFSDTLAYFTGRLLGKRKLSPRISPNKTIEGAIGGLIGAVIGSFACAAVLGLSHPWYELALFALIAGVFAQLGDLIESLVKRAYEVKDSGSLLPGHGGVLDRLDSILFAAPILFFMIF